MIEQPSDADIIVYKWFMGWEPPPLNLQIQTHSTHLSVKSLFYSSVWYHTSKHTPGVVKAYSLENESEYILTFKDNQILRIKEF